MKIAAIALRGMTILPGMVAHFDISRDKSIKAVEAAMNNNQRIFLVTQRDAEVDTQGGSEDMFRNLINSLTVVSAGSKLRARLGRERWTLSSSGA